MTDPIVRTAATQLLAGVTLATGGKTDCTACHRTIREGDAVGVYATRAPDADRFDTAHVHCRDCRGEAIPHETADATQLAAYARLGVTTDAASREAVLTVRDPEIVATSDADDETTG